MPDTPLVEVARRWLRAGFSVIPVQSDKRAYSSWKPYQVRPYQIEEVERAFNDPRAKYVAIVCGYGGVFCFDFDPDKNGIAKEPLDLERDFYTPWRDTAESLGIVPATQRTRSGGTHVLMLTPEPVGNIKLAGVEATPDADGKVRTHTAIETRGSGGYFLLYDLDLDPNTLPSITNEQFQTLLEAAADLDRAPEPATGPQNALQKRQHSGKKAQAVQDGLIGWFNGQHLLTDILERNRYRRVRDKYVAPDSTSGNAGVYLFQDPAGFWMCYSHHGDPLGDGHAHDAFDTFKVLEHGGVFESALGEVKREKDSLEGDKRFSFTANKKPHEATSALPFDKAIGAALRASLLVNEDALEWSFEVSGKEHAEFLRRYPRVRHVDQRIYLEGELAINVGEYYARLLGKTEGKPFAEFLNRARTRIRVPNPEVASNAENPVGDATSFNASRLASNSVLASNKGVQTENDLTPEKRFDAKEVASKDVTSGTKEMAFDANLKTAPSSENPASSGVKSPTPAQEIIHAMNPIRKWGERDRPDPVQWLVHNLFQDNAENLLAGEPGVGKSWISGDLAVSVATGTQFMGRHTAQGPVLIINLDDPSESLPRKFAEYSANGKGYTFEELPIFYWQPEERMAYPAEGIITADIFEYLIDQCGLIKPRLIIVDAFSSAFPGLDGNKGQDAIRAFEALRQLRMSAGKPSCMVLLDHTPKATMQDSKRRGVSGSQQKHAKTRTVHIVRKVEPSEVNGDDVLEWEVFKANAAPYQDNFGVDREVNELWNKASLTPRDLPPSGKNAAANRAAKAAVTYLRGRPGESVHRTDLIKEITTLTNSSKRSVERALNSGDFIDHPGVQKVDLGGRGNPTGFMWVAPTEPTQSYYSKLEDLVETGRWVKDVDLLLRAFKNARDGDDAAKDKIDEYLRYTEIKEMIASF